jgi:hypothetical protein
LLLLVNLRSNWGGQLDGDERPQIISSFYNQPRFQAEDQRAGLYHGEVIEDREEILAKGVTES